MNGDQSSSATSPSLLMRVRNPDDRESWKTFERIYSSIVRSYCAHWGLQQVDADDIVQEVMGDVAKQIKNFDYDPAKGRFRAWLGTISANKIKTFLTRANRRVANEVPIASEANAIENGYADPDSNWIEVFSEQILQAALENVRPLFEETTWKSFTATWIDQTKSDEVAKKLGIPVHSVYVNKSRVLKQLELEIRDLAEDLAYDF